MHKERKRPIFQIKKSSNQSIVPSDNSNETKAMSSLNNINFFSEFSFKSYQNDIAEQYKLHYEEKIKFIRSMMERTLPTPLLEKEYS